MSDSTTLAICAGASGLKWSGIPSESSSWRVSSATLVIPVGVGLQWELDSRTRLFVQASYDVLVKHLSAQSVPLLGGFEVHF